MFVHNLNPNLVDLPYLQIRYYGLMYALGFLITYFLLLFLAKERKMSLDKEKILDLIVYSMIGTILGGRMGYILFYNLPFYFRNPLEILAIWHGGMSFHGGFIGVTIAALIFCRKHKINFWKLADMTVIPLAISLFFGRIGNFINGELVGRITTVPWAFKFPGVEGYRHPSQLYEAGKNLFIFIVLWFNRNKKYKDGSYYAIFIMMYSVLRFSIEFFRQPDSQIGFLVFGLSMGQILCVISFSIGAYLWFRLNKSSKAN